MTNLFSSFDPTTIIMMLKLKLNWISTFILVLILPQLFWLTNSQFSKIYINIMLYLNNELLAVFSALITPGTIFIYLSLFFFILFSNFMGLFPYIFTSTSHMSMTLSLGLPLWLGSMIFSLIYQYNNIMAHLVPMGTPNMLMPVMVIIETVSSVIRPGTLSIRLAANMVAGHLLLTLMGSQGMMLNNMFLMLLMLGLILLIILEMAVACIQSYVFMVLNSLYLSELSNMNFNKYMS